MIYPNGTHAALSTAALFLYNIRPVPLTPPPLPNIGLDKGLSASALVHAMAPELAKLVKPAWGNVAITIHKAFKLVLNTYTTDYDDEEDDDDGGANGDGD